MYFNKKINRNESVFNEGELIDFSNDKILDIQINLTEAYDKFIKSEMDIFIFLSIKRTGKIFLFDGR